MRRELLLLGLLVPQLALAGDLASRVQQAYQDTTSLKADFTQKTRLELLEKEVEEQGTLLLAKPNRFVIHYQGRRERKYISDGKTLWIVRPQEKETEVFRNLDNIVSREALAFLSGLGEMDRSFRVVAGQGDATLLLFPLSSSSPFKRIVLTINPQSALAQEVTLYPKSGNRSHYRFSNIKTNLEVADREFHP